MLAVTSLLPIDGEHYIPSPLHAEDRVWIETNCYVDIWIELLHSLALDCTPALAFTLAIDFEGDQWQFFKFPPEDLRSLFGIEVAEMSPWRGLEHHLEEQLTMGRLLVAEVDACYLPDTAGVSYRLEHVKTSIIPNLIDRDEPRLEYFHNAGYYELAGDDYVDLLRGARDRPEMLLPYVELVKLNGLQHLDEEEMLRRALDLARTYVSRRPATNPVTRFRKRVEQDVEWLGSEGLATFHQYAFATLRQFGSAAELAGSFCAWLTERGEPLADAEPRFTELASAAKTAQFQLARTVSGRAIDLAAVLDPMERGWESAMEPLTTRYA
jgi:hypothetical protein